MNYYYFLDTDQTFIRIKAKRLPTDQSIPKRGTWVLDEYHSDQPGKWVMPCFPEITWGVLKRMAYIGKTKAEPATQGEKEEV